MFEFALPDVGEGVAEGEIVEWHVAAGDAVAEDQVIAEVETDKAVVDVPSPVAGTVAEVHWAVGDVVPVGDTLVTIDTEGEAAPTEAAAPAEGEDQAAAEADATVEGDRGRVFAPPRVRRLARELDVDLAAVSGSGPGGRLTEGDVRGAAEGGEPAPGAGGGEEAAAPDSGETAEAHAEAAGPPTGAGAADRERTLAAPATRQVARDLDVDIDRVPTDRERDGEAFVTAEQVRAFAEGGAAAPGGAPGPAAGEVAETREPYRGIRRTIGAQMEEAAYTAPHVSHHDSVEVSALVEARARMAEHVPEDVSLTYMPFVLKAVVAGLQEYPVLNTELQEAGEGTSEDAEIVYKHYYNVGVATATDRGLMVPVVEDVPSTGIVDLAREVSRLTTAAREGDIAREEMQGGTFSVTNFGAIGGEYATPIINYPETAILGLGAIEERPWVVDGAVEARPVLPLSLSIDHRVIDGAEAAQFVNAVKEYLANPSLLLLE